MAVETLSLEECASILFLDELINLEGSTFDSVAQIQRERWIEKTVLGLAYQKDYFSKIKKRETEASIRGLKPDVTYFIPEDSFGVLIDFQRVMVDFWSVYVNLGEAGREQYWNQVQNWLRDESMEIPKLTSAKG